MERKTTETRRHGFQIQKFVYILVNYRICEFGLKFRVKVVWIEIADQTEFRGPSCFHGNADRLDSSARAHLQKGSLNSHNIRNISKVERSECR